MVKKLGHFYWKISQLQQNKEPYFGVLRGTYYCAVLLVNEEEVKVIFYSEEIPAIFVITLELISKSLLKTSK